MPSSCTSTICPCGSLKKVAPSVSALRQSAWCTVIRQKQYLCHHHNFFLHKFFRILVSKRVAQTNSQTTNHNGLDDQFGTTLNSHTRKWLLMGKPATGFIDTGRIVCSCMSVGENTIVETIKKYHCKTVVEVGKHCKAGTNCGSCLGEISKILAGWHCYNLLKGLLGELWATLSFRLMLPDFTWWLIDN